MTVRRRLLGFAVAFAFALLLVTSATAQQRGDLPLDAVKARLDQHFNPDRGGGDGRGFNPKNLTPAQAKWLADAARSLGIPPNQNGQLSAEQAEKLGKTFRDDPKKFEDVVRKQGPPPAGRDPGEKRGPTPFGKNDIDPPPGVKNKGDAPPEPPTLTPTKRPEDKIRVPMPEPKIPNDNKVEPPEPAAPPELPPPPPKEDLFGKPDTPNAKMAQAVEGIWEKTVGPLDETPAVRKALFDIVDGTGDLKDVDGNSLWDTLSKGMGDGKGFGDLFSGLDGGGDWDFGGGGTDWSFPKMNWNFNWGNNRPPDMGSGGPSRESWFSRWRRSPSSSSTSPSWFSGWQAPRWNVGVPALNGTWWPVLFVIVALVGGVFLWKWLAALKRPDPNRVDPYALGPWPVDPHHLRTRQDVVVAFEHLSVLLCGPVAKTWTHTTIAGALAEVALAEPARALMLARLYELARYTPADEPLTTAELAEARRLVCRLAGFSDD